MYINRLIDTHLKEWSARADHKPVLLRGARQVGKSTAVRHLGVGFENFVEINFERQPEYKQIFDSNLDVRRIVAQIAAMVGRPIVEGSTLLFFDEIQECPKAIMSLRFFREDMPALHVVAAGSLLEFALEELPTFGVGRIHSMYMYPLTFDEFLGALGEGLLREARDAATPEQPLPEPLHDKLVSLLRTFIMVGGMPEAVAKWVETGDYLKCQEVQDDILSGYEDDFPKYRKKVNPTLLRMTLRSCAVQATRKFVYAEVGNGYKASEVKAALEMLAMAGIIVPVTHTAANGLPLGGEADGNIRKILLMDTGLMLRLLSMTTGGAEQWTRHVLMADNVELVNKGPLAEMLFGIEYLHYLTPHLRHEMFYWVRRSRNSLAEIDYVTPNNGTVLPVEVKAGVQGGMKSLWTFMAEKRLRTAVRSSLENFGIVNAPPSVSEEQPRHVIICPLYAVSCFCRNAGPSPTLP